MSDNEKTVGQKLQERDRLIRMNTARAIIENFLLRVGDVTNISVAEVAFATAEALVRMLVCTAKPGEEESVVKDIADWMTNGVQDAIVARDLFRAEMAMRERANTKDVGHG